jgi:hypothetical protein
MAGLITTLAKAAKGTDCRSQISPSRETSIVCPSQPSRSTKPTVNGTPADNQNGATA